MLQGLITALITPFKEGQLDKRVFETLVRNQLAAKVEGLLILGTTGESPTLTHEEKIWILEKTIQMAKGKTHIMVNCGTNNTQASIEFSKIAHNAGADSILIITPYYNKPTQKGIYEHFKSITENVDIPLVIYNHPGRSGVPIEIPTLAKLAELPHVIGIKEASGSLAYSEKVLTHIKSVHPHFSLLSGDDGLTFSLMALGGQGVISVAGNLIPEKMKQLTQYSLDAEWDLARKLHIELLPLFEALSIETNPIPIKWVMANQGLCQPDLRLPLTLLESQHETILTTALNRIEGFTI